MRILKILLWGNLFWLIALFSFLQISFSETLEIKPQESKEDTKSSDGLPAEEGLVYLLEELMCGSFKLYVEDIAVDLKNINPNAFKICQKIARNSLYGGERVEFKVDVRGVFVSKNNAKILKSRMKSKLSSCYSDHAIVLLGGDIVNSSFLDVVVAHELGHEHFRTSSQYLADYFAALLFGKEKISRFLDITIKDCLSSKTTSDKQNKALEEYLQRKKFIKSAVMPSVRD